MRKSFILFAFSAVFPAFLSAQTTTFVNQIVIGNGGVYSNPDDYVNIASYNPVNSDYSVFADIATQSVQDIIMDTSFIFVAAQDSLIVYDANTHEKINKKFIPNIRSLANNSEKLIVTRQYPAADSFIYILNKSNLEILEVITTSGETGNVVIVGDSAYIAVPGAYGTEIGKLAVIDLSNNILVKEIVFGSNAKGLSELFYHDSTIITVNTHFWDYMNNRFSISKYNFYTGDTTTIVFTGDYYGFYGNSVLADSNILIPLSSSINKINIFDNTIITWLPVNPAAQAFDSVNSIVYITESNYLTYGKLYKYDYIADLYIDSIDVGISPEAIAIDYRTTLLSTDFKNTENIKIAVYPNPCDSYVKVIVPADIKILSYAIYSIDGVLRYESNAQSDNEIPMNFMPSGVYVFEIDTNKGTSYHKIIKD